MKILIATDGSDFSRKAVEKCCEFLGKGNGANIKIITTSLQAFRTQKLDIPKLRQITNFFFVPFRTDIKRAGKIFLRSFYVWQLFLVKVQKRLESAGHQSFRNW